MNRALWPSTWGYYLEQMMGLGDFNGAQPGAFPEAEIDANVEYARRHFVDHVRAGGPLPTLRAGKQPYGILPVTALDLWGAMPEDGKLGYKDAAVVGLVVEEVRQRRGQRLGDRGRLDDGAVAEGAGEVGFRQARNISGDALVLGKPLGIGILSAALKKGKLSAAGYAEMVKWTTRLNTAGQTLADMAGVHALTDITGFGLAGHLLEICRGSHLTAQVSFDDLPLIAEAAQWARQGVATGASERNWKGYGHEVELPPGFPEWQRTLLSDPQTSGGLLVACSPDAVAPVLGAFQGEARRIGTLREGGPGLVVT